MNNVTLVGRTTKDIEIRETQGGTKVTSFTLAVERNFKNQQGERETDFINCVAWNKSAEILEQFVQKGNMVGVIGNIQTRNYENNEGQRVYVTEVRVNEVNLMPNGNNQGGQKNNQQMNNNNQQQNQQQNYQNNAQNNQNIAFNNQSNVNGQFNNQNENNSHFGGIMPTQGGTDIEVSQSDLPF